MDAAKIACALAAITVLSGCATTTHVRTDLGFNSRPDRIDSTVLLEVPPETRSYVTEAKYAWQAFRVPIGQAVEPNARIALGSVIEKVLVDKGSGVPDRIIEIAIAGAVIDLGTFTFSENRVDITLECKVRSSDGQEIWSCVASSEAGDREAIGFLGGFVGQSGYVAALRDASGIALQLALQQLADRLYQARDQVF